MHLLFAPFVQPQLNALELVSLCACFATFWLGLYLNDPTSGHFVQVIATLGIFVTNLMVPVVAAWIVIARRCGYEHGCAFGVPPE